MILLMQKLFYTIIIITCLYSVPLHSAENQSWRELWVEMPHCCATVRFKDCMTIAQFKKNIAATVITTQLIGHVLVKPVRPGYIAGSMQCKALGFEYALLEKHQTCADYELGLNQVVCLIPQSVNK